MAAHIMTVMHCDFCYAENPTHSFACKTFDIIDAVPTFMPMTSISEWYACDSCKSLIDADEREQLVDTIVLSVTRILRRDGHPVPPFTSAHAQICALIGQFWDNRTPPYGGRRWTSGS